MDICLLNLHVCVQRNSNGVDGSFGPSAHINNIRVLYTLNVNLGSYFMVRVSYLWICFCLTALVLFKEGYKTTNQDAK